MEYRNRQAIAMRIAPLVTIAILGSVFYRPGQPMFRQLYMRPLVTLGMLALAFAPVAIGMYFGRRRTPPEP
jgi:hypothetical protein